MSTLDDFLAKVLDGLWIDFNHTMAIIDHYYHYQPTYFRNGLHENPAGINEGSCKIFAFAKMHHLNPSQTLALFGNYYRIDVLENLDGIDHPNIRQFMQHGWTGMTFEHSSILTLKEPVSC
jgi:hypothetical protein